MNNDFSSWYTIHSPLQQRFLSALFVMWTNLGPLAARPIHEAIQYLRMLTKSPKPGNWLRCWLYSTSTISLWHQNAVDTQYVIKYLSSPFSLGGLLFLIAQVLYRGPEMLRSISAVPGIAVFWTEKGSQTSSFSFCVLSVPPQMFVHIQLSWAVTLVLSCQIFYTPATQRSLKCATSFHW